MAVKNEINNKSENMSKLGKYCTSLRNTNLNSFKSLCVVDFATL